MNSSARGPDYRATYNEYWSRDDRGEESSGDLESTAQQIVAACGIGSVLDIGSGEGALVSALVRKGTDARGVDVSDVVVARCNERMPGRFVAGSVLDLPFGPGSFDTVVSTGCLEHLAPRDVAKALSEMRRVARHTVFLKIATPEDRGHHGHLTVERRAWWELRCFEAGLRKHPSYYRLNDYEALNHDGPRISILLEKVPDDALAKYPLVALDGERGLHMDMLRDCGERSDAHVVRYQWASDFIKPGDRVLDVACGLGYGTHVIARLTDAISVLGVDGSDYAIDYAARSYTGEDRRTRFEMGLLPQALAAHPDASFDAVVSFETLEHVEDPGALLAEFKRLLTPGGRVIVSVPNDWSDETGKDPNPHHLHVYDWDRLNRELAQHFIVESAAAQTASRCKIDGGKRWLTMPRRLRPVELSREAPTQCEWWLMSSMKSPLGATLEYRERAFANIAGSGHPSIEYAATYRNPWLMHAMINVTYRLRNGSALKALALAVMQCAPKDSNDYAAALCVLAYRILEHPSPGEREAEEIREGIASIIAEPPPGPMGLRWKVSLLFVNARLLQAMGRLRDARAAFEACAGLDVRPFGIHLSTKATEAWFEAGRLALAAGDMADARRCWQQGVEYGKHLQSASLEQILIDRDFPNRFNYGDGVREYTLAWDNIARCANGLHLLARGDRIDPGRLQASFQFEYQTVQKALLQSHHQADMLKEDLLEVRRLLTDRTQQLEVAARDLVSRTQELVEVRAMLVERTAHLERANADLIERTNDLVATRRALAERVGLMESAERDIPDIARDLVETRQLLADNRQRLQAVTLDLDNAMKTLDERRQALARSTGQFESAAHELDQNKSHLLQVRKSLIERERQIDAVRSELRRKDVESAVIHQTLIDRTARLESASAELAAAMTRVEELAATLERVRRAPIRHAIVRILRSLWDRVR